jgi:hypothetical protein
MTRNRATTTLVLLGLSFGCAPPDDGAGATDGTAQEAEGTAGGAVDADIATAGQLLAVMHDAYAGRW